MPVAQATVLLQYEGTIGGSGSWATGLWTAMESGHDPLTFDMTALAAAAASGFRTLWTDQLSLFNANTTAFTKCTASYYAPGAKAVSAKGSAAPAAATVGSGFDSAAASQACCVTLQSPRPGRTGRGRMYLPATGALGSAGDQYRFPAARLAALGDALVGFFLNVESLSPDSSHVIAPVVRSLKEGQATFFQRFLIDQRPDRQEHRERLLTFTRLERAFA